MASRTGSLGRGCENDFGREDRAPFTGGGMFRRRAADEFVAAVEFADQAGGSEAGYGFNVCQTEPRGIC